MAVMWPRKLPPDVLTNPLRAAEIQVYEHLRDRLDDTWHVFYSRPWLGLTTAGEEIDGECDFVIAHAQHGMLCVEVKGGTISQDPYSGQWTSRDRWGITHNIKDPVEQAKSSKYELLKKLKEQPHMPYRWVRARHGVIFPHCSAPAKDLGPDRPLFIFCFYAEFEKDVGQWVRSRFSAPGERQGDEHGLGVDGMKALENLLAAPLTLRTPLALRVRAEDKDLEYLTQQQFHLLESIEAIPRVCIQGGAGTGKTVLAAHLARSLAEDGAATLLVCYNEPLAARLAAQHRDCSKLLVSSFHSLCYKVLRAVGAVAPESGSDRSHFFEESLPDAAIASASNATALHFDAIVVDEGQDFRELWWLLVDALLAPSGLRILRIFFDTNQRVYSSSAEIVKDLHLEPIHLRWNLRNTRAVHEAAYHFYAGREVSCRGPDGEPPVLVPIVDWQDLRGAVGKLVSRLIEQEGLDPDDLAILVPDESWVTCIAPSGKIASVPVVNASQPFSGSITLDTVRRFKGLESCIVIIVVDDKLSRTDELCYVSLSRGRTRVFLIGLDDPIRRILATT